MKMLQRLWEMLYSLYLFHLKMITVTNPTLLKEPSAISEVQGRTGYIYNLMQDQCVTVNSLYNKSDDTDKFNVITAIAILAEGTSGECHRVKVKRGQCQVYVDGFPFNGTFDEDGILVKTGSHGDVVSVVVPNCQERGHPGFMFQISCTQAESKEALELEALYVDGLLSTSHGLLGK